MISSIQMLLWRILLRVGYAAFAICPRQWRFACALKLSKVTESLLRWISYYPSTDPVCLDGHRECALSFVFNNMMQRGIEFDPVWTIAGADAIGPEGAIVISGHFQLNYLFIRLLHDYGRRATFVKSNPPKVTKIMGTKTTLDVIRADKMSLVHVRSRVAAGEIVAMAVDTIEEREGRPAITTPNGTVFISDEIIRLAARAQIQLLYMATRVADNGEIVSKVVRPYATTADAILEEFCQFLRSEIAQVSY